jgi:thiosulfate/3-mercaptopyruvate sulfurtransferase
VHIGHDESDYRAAHIPGGRFLPMDKFATGQTPPGTELLPTEQLKRNLEEIGIGDDSRVVYYAPDWDPAATRLFFTLDYLGHGNQAALLDGGLDQWTREKRPTSTLDNAAKPGSLTVHLHPEVLATLDYMKLVGEPEDGVVIVDARPSKRYRNGHLRGSGSFYWENALVSEKEQLLKSPEQIRELFATAGVNDKKKAVTYCEVGWSGYLCFLCLHATWKLTQRCTTGPTTSGVMQNNPWFAAILRNKLAACDSRLRRSERMGKFAGGHFAHESTEVVSGKGVAGGAEVGVTIFRIGPHKPGSIYANLPVGAISRNSTLDDQDLSEIGTYRCADPQRRVHRFNRCSQF